MAQPNCSLSNAIDLPSTFTWNAVEKTIILFLVPLVTLCGNVGNLAFLYTGIRVPRMRTVANMYLFNLAASDVLFLSTACGAYMWIFAVSPVIRSTPYNSAVWCWMANYPSQLCYYVSLEMVTLVSFERYYAICQPLKHRSFAGLHRTKMQITSCWLIAAILAVFATFKHGGIQSVSLCVRIIAGGQIKEPYILTILYCQTQSIAYVWVSLIVKIINDVLFLVAMISSGFTFVKIIRVLANREASNLQSNQKNSTNDVRRQVAIMLIVNGTIFFICQIPYRFYSVHDFTANVLKIWSLNDHQIANLTVFCQILLFINPAVNPYIYIALSKYYRQAFMEAVSFRRSIAEQTAAISLTADTKM